MDHYDTPYKKMVDELTLTLDRIKKEKEGTEKDKEEKTDIDGTYQPPMFTSICLDDSQCDTRYNLPSLILDNDTGCLVPGKPPPAVDLSYSSSSDNSSIHSLEPLENISSDINVFTYNHNDEEYVQVMLPSGSGYPTYNEEKKCCKCSVM